MYYKTHIFYFLRLVLSDRQKAGANHTLLPIIISIRSGLCDIISGTECRKIILYPEGKKTDGISSYKEFFSLEKMGICSDAIEIEIQNKNLPETAEKIFRSAVIRDN